MEISREYRMPDANQAIVLRSSRLGNLVACLATFGLCAGIAYALVLKAGPFSGLQLLLMGPFVALGGLVALLVCAAMWHSLLASLRPSNWSVIVRERELLINLRDNRNAPKDEPSPMLTLPTEMVQSARVAEERYHTKYSGKTTEHRNRYIDLSLIGADTTDLIATLQLEDEHPGIVTSKGKSKLKFHVRPLWLLDSKTLRLPHSARLQKALELVVRFEEKSKTDMDAEWESLEPLEQAKELHLRGRRIQAIQLLSEAQGIPRKEAKALLAKAA